jgi:release factor glutamine methyltransferase
MNADRYMKKIRGPGMFADWCTGSGCIAITLASENPLWTAAAVDSSREALAVALRNARRHDVQDRITFIECADPSEAAKIIRPGSLDLVVSNPPYIPTHEIESLEKQVREYEPYAALDGGHDGLSVIRLLLLGLPRYMKDGAPLIMETGGEDQARILAEAEAGSYAGLKFLRNFKDHRGIARFMLWIKSGERNKIRDAGNLLLGKG